MPIYLCIDYGSKRIGLAVSDLAGRMAMPVEMVAGRNNPGLDVQTLLGAIEEQGAQELVIGLPLNMDGSEGPQARLTRRFGDELGKRAGLPLHYQDERLSSAAAESLIREMPESRGRHRKPIDSLAAQITLQMFLDARLRADEP